MNRSHYKRKLTEDEIEFIQEWLNNAPQGRKPSIRTIAKHFGVNRPSIMKSLGGWDGIQRNAPQADKRPKVIDRNMSSPVKIEEYTTRVPEELNGK